MNYYQMQHESMAYLYINAMSDALQIIDQNNFLENNSYKPKAFYTSLAWIGLKEHNLEAYNVLSDFEKSSYDEIYREYSNNLDNDIICKTD
jgi:hypothetical protein